MTYKDIEKNRASKKKWYIENKEVYLQRNITRRVERVAVMREAKSIPCADCGMSFPYYVMDFDHREGEDKQGLVSRLANHGTMKRLLAEMRKCDVVCSNCHRIRTWTRKNFGE